MPQPITIPRLGWSMEEGVFSAWLKAPGDVVQAGDMLFLLEGEKAANEIESFDSGRLCIPPDAPQPGTTVRVGDVIGFLLADGEDAPKTVSVRPATPANVTSADETGTEAIRVGAAALSTSPSHDAVQAVPRAAGPAARRLARQLGIDLESVVTPDPTGRVVGDDVRRAARLRAPPFPSSPGHTHPVATPRARRRALENGVDWARLTGTGRNGRIRERDVLTVSTSHAPHPPLPAHEIPPTEPGRFVPASKLRKAIALRMAAGLHQAVPVTLTTKIDADRLVAFRNQLKADADAGPVPTYNDILLHHAAQTLRELPALNACWHRDGIHCYDAVHVATAVDTPDGLLAPVVRDADRLTLAELAHAMRELVEQARAGQLGQHQLTGGTFTISNLGMYGIDAFTPVLNLPQAAILGIGRIVSEPVVRCGSIVVGQSLTLSLTFDHRVTDGAPAARWLQRLGERLQAPVSSP